MFTELKKVNVPPIKIQGIKTKLVPFINDKINWDGNGTYYEPFVGSGVVGFNLAPEKAIFSDTNPFLIQFYKDVQSGKITSDIVREYLELEGKELEQSPIDKNSYYYVVRNRFNENHDSLDFLFLQRSNFNGMIRFNGSGRYNVPFGRKANRFQKALITKIVNQVKWIEDLFKERPQWDFVCQSFEQIFEDVQENDFIYLDPPYIDRYDGYYDEWSQEKAELLAELTQKSKSKFAFSMWYENQYRKNEHIDLWTEGTLYKKEHFYHVGASEKNRNAMTECLIVR